MSIDNMKIIDNIKVLSDSEKENIVSLLSWKKTIKTKKQAMDLLYLADKVWKNNIALKIGKLDENIFAFWKNSKATLITGNDLEQLLDVLALTYLENNKNNLNKDELKDILQHIKFLELENKEINKLSFSILSELSKLEKTIVRK